MDGYSVEEAAQVLGIPEGRVWELIARGVLAGASEGRTDMRVFLRPPAGSGVPPAGTDTPDRRSNGGDAPPAFEASPFRELLTEFRNLTERYGQALLALGEARGEVASLRSRVDLLEARMDMRLPLRAASTVAWELPDRYGAERSAQEASSAAPAPASEVTLPETPEPPVVGAEAAAVEPEPVAEPTPDEAPEPPAEQPDTPEVTVVVHADEAPAEPHRRRVTGGRAAIAGLAEALARAEDPTLADLPGAREAGEALAALQRDAETASPTAAVEPEPAEPELVEPEVAEPELVEPAAADDIQAAFAPPIESAEEAMAAPPDVSEPEAAPTPDEPPVGTEPESTTEIETPSVEAVGPPSPYTTEVVEPDWFADGDFTWLDAPQQEAEPMPEVAIDDEPEPMPEPEPQPQPMPEPEPEPEPAAIEDEPPAEADVAEADHIQSEDEAPAVEALQDAFERPAEPEPIAEEPVEREPVAEEPAPTTDAIQDAFDEPDASHFEAEPADAGWRDAGSGDAGGAPRIDEPRPITGDEAVGFNLFRERPIAIAAPPMSPPEGVPDEEAVLWFGDEFEAAELEVAGAGWRNGERQEAPQLATPVAEPVQPDEETEADAMSSDDAVSDEDIARLAGNEGWSPADVDALRAYLVRGETPRDSSAAPPAGTGPDPQTATPGLAAAPLDQDWLRGRRGPAATAYRRLRRIFQG
jgi:hypothetical protein